jgi:DNA-binding IclR family transcriptional regulator
MATQLTSHVKRNSYMKQKRRKRGVFDMSMDDMNDEKSYSAPALEKGLDIMEALADRVSAISVRDLAETLGRSKNEIFRMIHVLIARGYVERDPETDELTLTNKLFALGLQTPRSKMLLSVALPEITKLAEEVDHPHIIIIHKGRTVTMAHVSASSDFTFNLNTGYGRPAADATSGKVIMAFQSADNLQKIFSDCDQQSGARVDRVAVEAQLATIRARGYVFAKSTDFFGITDICMPILNAEGHAIACILVTHVDRVPDRLDEAKAVEAVRLTCERIRNKM